MLPSLPMFLVVPWLLRRAWSFWAALGAGALLTIILYLVTVRILQTAGLEL